MQRRSSAAVDVWQHATGQCFYRATHVQTPREVTSVHAAQIDNIALTLCALKLTSCISLRRAGAEGEKWTGSPSLSLPSTSRGRLLRGLLSATALSCGAYEGCGQHTAVLDIS